MPNSSTILPYFFIGDGAYSLLNILQKPYPGLNLLPSQIMFNRRLSRARVVVECAFGKLCQKWQIFYKPIQCTPKMTQLITKCVCVLHNLIINLEGSGQDYRQIDESTLSKISENYDVESTNEIREKLKNYLMQNPIRERIE